LNKATRIIDDAERLVSCQETQGRQDCCFTRAGRQDREPRFGTVSFRAEVCDGADAATVAKYGCDDPGLDLAQPVFGPQRDDGALSRRAAGFKAERSC